MVDEAINKADKETEENTLVESDTKKKYLSGIIPNAFSSLSYLVCQSGGKAAFLNLLSTTEASVTEFPDFITKLISVHEKETDLTYLGSNLLPLFQSICDHEVCLADFDGEITLQHLSNSLPSSSNLKVIVELLFSTLNTEKLPLSIVIRTLDILQSLTDHDYGMQIMKEVLSTKGKLS